MKKLKEVKMTLFEDRGVLKIEGSLFDLKAGKMFGGIKPLKRKI